jgi:hypothetical protein
MSPPLPPRGAAEFYESLCKRHTIEGRGNSAQNSAENYWLRISQLNMCSVEAHFNLCNVRPDWDGYQSADGHRFREVVLDFDGIMVLILPPISANRLVDMIL